MTVYSLHKHLLDHVNAEVALGTITSIEDSIAWLKRTFLYQRVMKAPERYSSTLKKDSEAITRHFEGRPSHDCSNTEAST